MSKHKKEGDVRCTARTKRGSRCKAPKLIGSDRCGMHSTDPAVQRAMERTRMRAGLAVAIKGLPAEFRRPDFSTHQGIRLMIEDAASAVAAGAMTASSAQALASLGNVALRASELAIELKLAELEERVASGKTKRRANARVIEAHVVKDDDEQAQ